MNDLITLELNVEGDSHDETMRALCNAMFDDGPLVPVIIRSRIENSVRFMTCDMRRGQSCALWVSISTDILGNGSFEIRYRFFPSPQKPAHEA